MGAQISQQSSGTTITIDKATARQYANERQVLKSELVIKSEEIQFLRKRIINDFTEYINLLEEELRKEKSKSSEKKKVIEKYASLCRKLDGKLRAKEKQNETVLAENNKLLWELFDLKNNTNNFDEVTSNPIELDLVSKYGFQHRELFDLLTVHEEVEELKSKVDVAKRKLFEESPDRRRSTNEIRFSQQIYDYNKCKDKLENQGIVVRRKDSFDIEEIRRRIDRRSDITNEIKIDAIGNLFRVEHGLRNVADQLAEDIGRISAGVKPLLTDFRKILQEDFKDDYTPMNNSRNDDEAARFDNSEDDNRSVSQPITKLDDYLLNNGGNSHDRKGSIFYDLDESEA